MDAIAGDWTTTAWILGLVSLLTLAISAVALPWVLVRLPPDYLDRRRPRRRRRGPLYRVARNGFGVLLLLAGLAMLALPGQGLLAIACALVLLEFPGKHGVVRAVLACPAVLGAANTLRRRFDRPPLEPPRRRCEA